MITEDYVNADIAKLLEEKGFPVKEVQTWYCEFDGYPDKNIINDRQYPIITHQIVIKWLREIHKIVISFNASFVNSIEPHFSWEIRINSLTSLNDEKHFEPIYIHVKSELTEKACEEAIKYCLTNLI